MRKNFTTYYTHNVHTHTHTLYCPTYIHWFTHWEKRLNVPPPTVAMWSVSFFIFTITSVIEELITVLCSFHSRLSLLTFIKETWSCQTSEWQNQQPLIKQICVLKKRCLGVNIKKALSHINPCSLWVFFTTITCPPGELGVARTCPSGYRAAGWWRWARRSQWWSPDSASPPGPRSWATPPPHHRRSCPKTRPRTRSLWERQTREAGGESMRRENILSLRSRDDRKEKKNRFLFVFRLSSNLF